MNRSFKSARPPTVFKAVGFLGLFFLLAVVMMINIVPPASGYEISLYGVYPWYFWTALILTIFSGQIIILGSAVYGDENDRSWAFGVTLILLSNSVLLSMPYIRGYPIYGRGDVLTHLGFVRDTAEIGIAGNIYPLLHISVQSLSHATGLPTSAVINFFPIIMSFVFFGGLTYLVISLFKREHGLFCLAFITIPFVGGAHSTAVPFSLSVLFVPFVLYLLFKEQQTNAISIRVAFVLALVGLVLYHPLTAIMLMIAFGMYVTIKRTDPFRTEWPGPTMVASLTTVIFAAWYLRFTGIVRRFEIVTERILGSSEGETDLEGYAGTVDAYSPAFIDLVEVTVIRYGVEVLLFGLAAVFVVYSAYQWIRKGSRLTLSLLFFSCVFLLFTGLSVAFLVNDFLVGWGRPLAIGKIFATILAASVFYRFWNSNSLRSWRPVVSLSLITVLLILSVLVVFSVFPTLTATQHNHQVTEMEIDGMEWMLENRNVDIPMDVHRFNQYRFEHLHNGTLNETVRQYNTRPPDHFGYDSSDAIGESYEQDSYLVINRLGEETYPKQFPGYEEYWRFTPADFDQLEQDRSVSRIYDNGEVRTYYVTTQST